jgi:hypothetical protein
MRFDTGLRPMCSILTPGKRWRLVLAAAMLCGMACLVGGGSAFPQERAQGSDFIRVTEEPWKIGEVRSYTLQFDRVSFGREAIRLMELKGTGRERRLTFGQTLTLDLRALGQAGFLTLHSTIRYMKSREALAYSVESELRNLSGYSTYPKAVPREARSFLSLELRDQPLRMQWESAGAMRDIPVPRVDGAMLVDPLSMVTWERLFLGDTWRVGESRPLDLLLPAGPVRFDYHLDSLRPRPPVPERIHVTVSVEDRETVDVFSVPIPAFRCRIPEMGLSLWVSGSGGILKYDDGRGLVALLER